MRRKRCVYRALCLQITGHSSEELVSVQPFCATQQEVEAGNFVFADARSVLQQGGGQLPHLPQPWPLFSTWLGVRRWGTGVYHERPYEQGVAPLNGTVRCVACIHLTVLLSMVR
jgi:hypothetical protein